MAQKFFKLGRSRPGKDHQAAASGALIQVDNGRQHALSQLVTIGRAPECEIRLDRRAVSRHHARIFLEGGHYWIKDLGSANGTVVNGKKIQLQMLVDGDLLLLGDIKATFRSRPGAKGPVPIAEDPLAGTEAPVTDGTPTGGLEGGIPLHSAGRTIRPSETTMGVPALDAGAADSQLQSLTRKVEELQSENQRLRREVFQLRSGTTQSGAARSEDNAGNEIEQLKLLVARLERALTESNLRIRNLQQRLDQNRS